MFFLAMRHGTLRSKGNAYASDAPHASTERTHIQQRGDKESIKHETGNCFACSVCVCVCPYINVIVERTVAYAVVVVVRVPAPRCERTAEPTRRFYFIATAYLYIFLSTSEQFRRISARRENACDEIKTHLNFYSHRAV